MQVDKIEDDEILPQREYVFLRRLAPGSGLPLLKFSTLPNTFCAQGDGRWWHDHRTLGGIMFTSNALGHFIYSRSKTRTLQDKDKVQALEHAMRTISNAYREPSKKKSGRMRHCPATFLSSLTTGEKSPLQATSEFREFSPDRYQGFFHTDHLILSVFFKPERDPKQLKLYDNLSLRYIVEKRFDPACQPASQELLREPAGSESSVRSGLSARSSLSVRQASAIIAHS